MHPTDVQLNDYVDDALAPAEREGVNHHLSGCTVCRLVIVDLQDLRDAVRRLPAMELRPEMWARLEHALCAETYPSSRSALLPSGTGWRRWGALAAAAAFVIAALVGLQTGLGQRSNDAAVGGGSDVGPSMAAELSRAEEHYEKAIVSLEQATSDETGNLDPMTAGTLRTSLAVVDLAVEESRTALRVQPDNESAQQSLLSSFRAKVALLEDTVALINEMRKGNDAGAASIVSGLKRGI